MSSFVRRLATTPFQHLFLHCSSSACSTYCGCRDENACRKVDTCFARYLFELCSPKYVERQLWLDVVWQSPVALRQLIKTERKRSFLHHSPNHSQAMRACLCPVLNCELEQATREERSGCTSLCQLITQKVLL